MTLEMHFFAVTLEDHVNYIHQEDIPDVIGPFASKDDAEEAGQIYLQCMRDQLPYDSSRFAKLMTAGKPLRPYLVAFRHRLKVIQDNLERGLA